MAFPTPTTKDEMFSILKDIFYYYRVKRAEFEEIVLVPLSLKRMEYTPLDDEKLLEKAQSLIAYEQSAILNSVHENIISKINDYEEKCKTLTESYNQSTEKINSDYNSSMQKMYDQALKRGIAQSGIITDQMSELETEKNNALNKLKADYDAEYSFYTNQITALESRISGLESEYTEQFEEQKQAKYLELKDEQDKTVREIFKYNNGLDEKEQRNKNSIAQANANMQLKYMEIRAENFTKDQLIEMGYYEDVIDCICDYYDTMAPLTAYQEVANTRKLMIYLEDFYSDLVYMYQSRAGL